MLRDQTYEDLYHFVQEREKHPWRTWDKRGYYYKPEVTPMLLNAGQLTSLIDFNLNMIALIEPKFNQLVTDIPPYNLGNAEMIQFCTWCFGNEGWL